MTSQEINALLEKQRKYYRSGATIPVKTRCFIKSFKDKCIVVAVTELVCNVFYEFILYFKLSVFCFKYLHFSFELVVGARICNLCTCACSDIAFETNEKIVKLNTGNA